MRKRPSPSSPPRKERRNLSAWTYLAGEKDVNLPTTEEGEEKTATETLCDILNEADEELRKSGKRLQVTVTGWKAELEQCEAQLAAAQREAESIRVDLTEALTNVGRELAAAQEEVEALRNQRDVTKEANEGWARQCEGLKGLLMEAAATLDEAELAMNHALELEYCGEGSTRGMVSAALKETRKTLARLRSGKDGGKND